MLNPYVKLRDELRSARHEPESIARLREFSPISWFFERVLFWAEFVSPSILFIPTRSLTYAALKDLDDPREKESYVIERMLHRARHVDLYILLWVVFEVLLALVLHVANALWLLIMIRALMALRVIDIAQANINLNVFDRLRFAETSHVTVSVTRNLILAAITYVELVVVFAVVYATMPLNIHGVAHLYDCLYFSMTTQLTVGYGDLHPVGVARYIATIQGMVGLFFSLLIMSRFVSLLPAVRTVFGDDARHEQK
ncbi:MAG: potassium channel family protein [Bacteroidota bacterium]|nr:potassium channel family protein [Bacteroidota bacterium]MDP4233045.1 potassium channel family protein [Bacteroidota bacterium]MDP4241810.1 potassium channel family protein [Bacteroidota bacterium]MDP4288769.1 potassium channel family protein [Bacteroidota bacterium]